MHTAVKIQLKFCYAKITTTFLTYHNFIDEIIRNIFNARRQHIGLNGFLPKNTRSLILPLKTAFYGLTFSKWKVFLSQSFVISKRRQFRREKITVITFLF